MKLTFSILLILSFSFVFSQKEAANWYFGDFAGLNFNSGNPLPLLDGKLVTSEGCASISDPNGNLLFYTDGVTVWDRRHEIMPNGSGLLGHSSSTESALIIPKPGSKTRFYIFTIDQPSYFLKDIPVINGVNYSEVDLALNNGFGDVVDNVKNFHLITYNPNDSTENKYKSSEKITAVTHSNGSSIWVITNFRNRFFSFLVDFNGVNSNPIISTVQQMVQPIINDEGANVSAIGYLKVSPNGKKIAIAHSSTSIGGPRTGRKKSGKVLLYDYNNSNGIVSNQLELLSGAYPYGLEFSPNSKLLYVTNSTFDETDTFLNGQLYQYNLENYNIINSRQTIISSQNIAGALQLAIDGKIYRSGYKVFSTGLDISVIKKPNNIGVSCNYSENSIYLGGRAAKLGLPPFVQSIFLYTFDYEYTCLGDQTHFFITSEEPYDSVVWDFGDGQTSTEEEPYHVFNTIGVYSVNLTMSLNGVQYDPLIKQVIISDSPNVLSDIYDLVQCDSYDDDSNDGITTFNLEQANAPISLNTNDAIQVYYYQSVIDATNDTLNINALNYVYTNQTQDELLYAKVYKANTECYNMATIRLKTTQPVDIGKHELSNCDFDNDNFADFDLESEGSRIAAQLSLPSNVSITFYESESDAAIGVNALPNIYTSSSKGLFIRAESDNACYGDGELKLNVKSFPQLNDQSINICKSDFPININTGLDTNLIGDYKYIWSTSETTNEIFVNESGIYEVNIYDESLNCEDSITITVKQNQIPDIQDIIIDGHSITVLINSEEKFLFALDDINGVYQESNTILNIPEGYHQVFIKDINSCETISESFYIFGFPKYFTPNNDGTNDNWNVYGLDPNKFILEIIHVEIYDRYGKLLKSFNPLTSSGWNGTFNGTLLTPDDYWYFFKLPNGEVYKGHFSLKI
ncbi:gliding motility-associated C-terminal domain-containing protein [Flaviramulus basaltis]|uniref:Gliding motility-associated C-terminal domain-containing protein n=1 Tax=Flaviramulus basaltis TaxID=369401 RepID=A0A1K2IC33_9FLAO|nr:T9SS type B sorting domain-containing protein [Flaviramulus basaltis]SFZ89275.1 gliding motility-associated C-terminal domain-containing protein [Flaviramulus basaltis]